MCTWFFWAGVAASWVARKLHEEDPFNLIFFIFIAPIFAVMTAVLANRLISILAAG